VRAVGIGALAVPGLPPAAVPRAGPLRARCGDAAIAAGGNTLPLLPRGTVADLDAGRPLPAASCAGRVAMGKDVQTIEALPGPFSIDLLRMRSPASRPAAAPAGGGTVVDPGTLHESSLTGAEVRLRGPSWLVLGESYSTGWRATCDGRDLGEPRTIDAYANGWPVPAGCRRVSFHFAPQRLAVAGYAASGVVVLALLSLLVAGAIADRRRRPDASAPAMLPDVPPRPLPLPRAAALALAATIPLCLIFALRTGLVIFPLLTLVLWRGVGPRRLTVAAALLLGIVIPLIYALSPPHDRGGYNIQYSNELIGAHWAGVLAIVLLGTAGWRMLAAARAQRPPAAPRPPEDREAAPAGGAEPARELAAQAGGRST
jgi:hypothetical protein